MSADALARSEPRRGTAAAALTLWHNERRGDTMGGFEQTAMWERKWLGRSKSFRMRLAMLPRHVTAAVALVLAASCSSATAPISQASSSTRTVAPPKNVGVGRSRREAPAPIRRTTHVVSNGVGINFSTSTDQGRFALVRRRLLQSNVDDIRFGQPPSPAYCMPQESFTISFAFGSESYTDSGWAPIGSGVPLRVLSYGEDQHSAYVIARSYDPTITSIHVELGRPALTGTMKSLGGHWYVFAAPIGTSAPWYIQGILSATRPDGTSVTMSVPEGLDRQTRC